MAYRAENRGYWWVAGGVLVDDLSIIGGTPETGEGPIDTSEENNFELFSTDDHW